MYIVITESNLGHAKGTNIGFREFRTQNELESFLKASSGLGKIRVFTGTEQEWKMELKLETKVNLASRTHDSNYQDR